MNNLCTDIGYSSINKSGEELCGDHIDIAEQGETSTVVVLADGLGSGVKASILSTLTSKIISTMLAAGLGIEDCVSTIASTLPICSMHKVAYSTFTIIHIVNGEEAEIIQYDNPNVILLRDGKSVDYPTNTLHIGEKEILRTKIPIYENDLLIAMSDGVPHAGIGLSYNFGWQRSDIIDFLATFFYADFPAKTLSTVLLDECVKLYEGKPGDDATVCVVKIKKRVPMNLIIGPPSSPDDCDKMMSLFFSKEGKHIVCGGTTSTIAAGYLRKPLIPRLDYIDPDIPPTAEIEGVDLVTEGVITINKVLSYAKDYLRDNEGYRDRIYKRDGASQIARLLFEEATDINLFVGTAVNPAQQNPALPINFSIKMRLMEELADCLKKMGKKVKLSYF
ncbi:MAG: SpoIIE family protein phosphatase [Clostridiales bacterium]|nr:SpoIIE family protein phosphatase [Clostridiales bacterium]